MPIARLIPRLRPLAAALMVAAFAAAPAAAGPAEVVSARLLPGWRTAGGTHMAALALTLAPGWKTYWRAPGAAGIPPLFDWSGSANLAGVTVHWPRPQVIAQAGGSLRSIGYRDRVVLPLELRPAERGGEIALRLTVDLGVCEDVCMPVRLSLSGRLAPPGARDPTIAAALADRPLTAAEAGVTRFRCRLEPAAEGLRLTAEIALPLAPRVVAAAVETADPALWVGEPRLSHAGNRLMLAADILPDGGGPVAVDRGAVRVTLIAPGEAVELEGCPPA